MSDTLPAVQPTAQLDVADTTRAAAAVSRSKAEVEAAFVVAKRFPRDVDEVRARVLQTCARRAFANNKSALYSRPVGGGSMITGPGIRLAEELVRELGNIQARTEVIDETDDRLVIRAVAVDLQTNMRHEQDVVIKKLVERRSVRQGQEVVGQRETSRGDTVYIVRATPDEVFTKTNAMGSKALRNVMLRLVPADLVDEAIAAIEQTRKAEAAEDPDAYKKRLLDAFATLRIMPAQLAEYLGHPVDQCSPAELVELRKVWQRIDKGESRWADIMDEVRVDDRDAGEFSTDDMEAGDESEHEGHGEEPPVETVSLGGPSEPEALVMLEEIGLGSVRQSGAFVDVIMELEATTLEELADRLEDSAVQALAVDGIGPKSLERLKTAVGEHLERSASLDAEAPKDPASEPAGPPAELLARLDGLYNTQPGHFDAAASELGIDLTELDGLDDLDEDNQLALYTEVRKRIDAAGN